MRGKEKGRRTHKVKSGITPAYAGKSAYLSPEDTAGRDHPRVCGEKYSWEKSTCKIFGSPPRMRGKGSPLLFWALRPGITPAYAGKRTPRAVGRASGRDHPRVCGEKVTKIRKGAWGRGSPPRMRGKDRKEGANTMKHGITPAYAGKSWVHSCFHFYAWDHPRVCGEKTKKIPSHRPFQLHPVPVSFSFA